MFIKKYSYYNNICVIIFKKYVTLLYSYVPIYIYIYISMSHSGKEQALIKYYNYNVLSIKINNVLITPEVVALLVSGRCTKTIWHLNIV